MNRRTKRQNKSRGWAEKETSFIVQVMRINSIKTPSLVLLLLASKKSFELFSFSYFLGGTYFLFAKSKWFNVRALLLPCDYD